MTQFEAQIQKALHDANVAADFTQVANDVEASGGDPAVVEELRDAAVEYAERAADLTFDIDAAYGITG